MKKTIIFALFFVLLLPVFGSFAEEMSNEEKKLLELQSEIAQQRQKLKITRAEEQRALSSLYLIRKNLIRAQKSLTNAKVKVTDNKKEITKLKFELSDAEKKIKRQSVNLEKRLKEVYKSGSDRLLDIIFASKSMADFINRSYYFGRIISRDVDLIANIKQQIETIKSTRSQLELANVEIKDMVKVIETEKREISRSSAEKEKAYQSLRARRKEYEKRVRMLEASSLEIEKFIRARGKSAAVSSGRFIWPMKGRIVSRYGYRRHPIWGGFHLHAGIDIAAPYGKPIACADSGEVIFSGWWDGYGKAVVIDHGRGYTTVYGHMSRIYMQAGQKVEKSQVIGLIGSTGFSTGPHLHFEIRYNGKPIDPLAYLI